MLADKLSIYVDTFSLCKLIGQYQQGHRVKGDRQPSMPKFARYGIMNDCLSRALRLLDVVYEANKYKSKRYYAYDSYLEIHQGIKSRVRLMGELRWLTTRQTTNIMSLLGKTGRQATALRNASQSPCGTLTAAGESSHYGAAKQDTAADDDIR